MTLLEPNDKLHAYSELAFVAESVFHNEFVIRCQNLSCLQRIGVRCRKCVSFSEFVIRCWNWVVCSELALATESMCSASLLKVYVLQRISIRCWNCVVYSELTFAAEVVLSVVNQRSLPKVYCLQRICDSLSKLSCLQWISICCQNYIGCGELAFVAEIVLSAVNEHSLSKWCCLQQISVCCRKCVVCSKLEYVVVLYWM